MSERITDAWACPACKAVAGQPCHVPIDGVDTTGWEHDARILMPVYADLRAASRPTPDAHPASRESEQAAAGAVS